MNLNKEIQAIDDSVIDGMNNYAISRLRSVGAKDFNGKEPIDFVGDVLVKIVEGKRDWSKAECSFKEFLFGCLRSEISNFFSKQKIFHSSEIPESSETESVESIEKKRQRTYDILKKEGADDDELMVFECWMEGVTKSSEVAQELGIKPQDVYNITRRLERKRPLIGNHIEKIL